VTVWEIPKSEGSDSEMNQVNKEANYGTNNANVKIEGSERRGRDESNAAGRRGATGARLAARTKLQG
jgi:hypothetical protein